MPRPTLASLQALEYLRAFHIGRAGWAAMNGLPLISGAFGVYRRDVVLSLGGLDASTVGEDLELVVRMQRVLLAHRSPMSVRFVPHATCWTTVPDSLAKLRGQRIRWQQGLAETLLHHRRGLFSSSLGPFGMLALPFLLVFELLGPLVHLTALLAVVVAAALQAIPLAMILAITLLDVVFGIFITSIALLLDERTRHAYPKRRHIIKLCGLAVIENVTASWLRGGACVDWVGRWCSTPRAAGLRGHGTPHANSARPRGSALDALTVGCRNVQRISCHNIGARTAEHLGSPLLSVLGGAPAKATPTWTPSPKP